MNRSKVRLRSSILRLILPILLAIPACGQIMIPDLSGAGVKPRIADGTRTANPPVNGEATIEVLDVGQGDSILIRSPEGKTALIDAGPSNHIVTQLRDLGIHKLDLVVVSHHHSDHYGGMRAVIHQYHPNYFMATNAPHTTASYLRLLKDVQESTMKMIYPTGQTRRIELGSIVLTVFPEAPNDPKEENNNSIGIRLDYGLFSMLLTGDSEEKEREWWVKTCPSLIQDANVLKLAHHGSRNGTDAEWLTLIRPDLTIASLGAGNDYGHPHPETVSLLARKKIRFLRTDQDGSVVITTDGSTWQYEATGPTAGVAKHESKGHVREASVTKHR